MLKIMVLSFLLVNTLSVPEITIREVSKTDEEVKDIWLDNYKNLRYIFRLLSRVVQPIFYNFKKEPNVTTECKQSFDQLMQGLKNNKAWAFKLLDSWGKLPPGLLFGALTDFGSYSECQSVVEDVKQIFGKNGRYLSPHYCIIDYRPFVPSVAHKISSFDSTPDFLNLTEKDSIVQHLANYTHVFLQHTIRIGICVPSSCNARDSQTFFKNALHQIGITGSLNVSHCDSDIPVHLSKEQKVVIITLSVLILVLIIGTLLDITSQKKEDYFSDQKQNFGLMKKVFLCFSLNINTKKLFHIDKSTKTLKAMHGIRVLSLLWIIVCHSYLYVDTQSISGIYSYKELFRNFNFQFVVNGTLSVDTFFFLSGLLVSYSTIKLVQKFKTGLNIPVFICYRFFRLSPTYMLVIGLVFILPLISYGPVWNMAFDPEIEKCRNGWWKNFLYINNFLDSDKGCLDHSWYLATDTQLYMLSLLVLIPLSRWPTIGLTINFLLLIIFTIITAVLNVYMELPPTALTAVYADSRERLSDWAEVYYKPYPHAGSYCIGIVTGYLFIKKSRLIFKKWMLILGWLVVCVASAVILFSARNWNLGYKSSPWISALYASTSRTVWSICVAWVIIVCEYGYGGIVNSILSCKLFVPFSRVCYSAYLIHPLIQWIYNAQLHERIYPSHYNWTYMVIGHSVISFASAIVLSLMAESPFLSLQKLIFGKTNKTAASNEFNSKKNYSREKVNDKNHINTICHSRFNMPYEKDQISYVCRL